MFGITIMEVTLALTILMFIALVVNAMVLGKALELIDDIHESMGMFLHGIVAIESMDKMSTVAQEEVQKLFEDEWP